VNDGSLARGEPERMKSSTATVAASPAPGGGPAAASGCVNAGNETEAPLSLRLGRLQRRHAASTERLRQAMRLAFGDDDVGMVEEPVDGRRREALREDRVEAGRVKVRGENQRARS
jgi:hypothetical protein